MHEVERATPEDRAELRMHRWSCTRRVDSQDEYSLPWYYFKEGHCRSLVIRDDDSIVCHMVIRSYETQIRGVTMPLAGVGDVATEPHRRSEGLVRSLFKAGYRDMKDEGEVVTLLHPFVMEFYEKLGYATIHECPAYNIEGKNFHKITMPEGITVRELHNPHEAGTLLELQKSMARFGSRVFSTLHYLELAIEKGNCYLFERDGNPIGWVKIYVYCSSKGWHVGSLYMAYEDDEALRAIMSISRAYAQQYNQMPFKLHACPETPILDFTKDRFAVKIERYGAFQMRIIDFKRFCELIQIPEDAKETVVIQINDPLCEWNCGSWKLIPKDGNLRVEKTDSPVDIIVDDLMLSRLVSGLSTPIKLHIAGRLDCSRKTAERLETIFPEDHFMIYDLDL